MSYPATKWAWEQPVTTAADRLVLLCLADHLNQGSRRLFPSIETMAKRTRLGQRTVSRSLVNLTDLGCVQIVSRGGPGRANTYRLAMPSPATQAGVQGQHLPKTPRSPARNDGNTCHSGNPIRKEPRSNQEVEKPHLKKFKVGSPEVRAMAMVIRNDLTPEQLDAFDRKFVEKNGNDANQQPKYWRWLKNERSQSGPSKDQIRTAELWAMARRGEVPAQNDGEPDDVYIRRIDAWTKDRPARLERASKERAEKELTRRTHNGNQS